MRRHVRFTPDAISASNDLVRKMIECIRSALILRRYLRVRWSDGFFILLVTGFTIKRLYKSHPNHCVACSLMSERRGHFIMAFKIIRRDKQSRSVLRRGWIIIVFYRHVVADRFIREEE